MPRALHLIQPNRAAAGAPIIDKIAVIGLGHLGGSIALAARETWPSALVIGVDEHATLEKAMVRHAVDVASHDAGIIGDAGLIVLAHDEGRNLEWLRELPRHAEGSAIVTDTGSTKAAIVEAARDLPHRLTFIGGHPVVEPSDEGIEAARADLYQGSRWVLVPPAPPNEEALERLGAVVSGLGASPSSMSAADHDRLFAVLAHMPPLAVAGVLAVFDQQVRGEDLSFLNASVSALARLAPEPARRWGAIAHTNATDLGAALDQLIEVLQALRAHLPDGPWVEGFVQRALALGQKASPKH